ncbi:hypothetical protein RI367_002163 [Sorochytrium milnesiophthora]
MSQSPAPPAVLRKRGSLVSVDDAQGTPTRQLPSLAALATGSAYHSHADLPLQERDDEEHAMDKSAQERGAGAQAQHDGHWFLDEHGRRTIFRGVNLSGNCKLPYTPSLPTHVEDGFYDDLCVSFVGRPFPLDAADEHLARLRSWGFNFVRLLVTWEAIEHFGPRIYDEEYIDYIIEVVRAAKRHGIRCFVDPHQDVWSRHCGGSGAPNWTLRLVGLDATKFNQSGAAIVHNTWCSAKLPWAGQASASHATYPKMIWQTNYTKAAAGTMFTLFFGGALFAPELAVQDPVDGNYYNAQHYLQFHYIQSICHLAKRLQKQPDLGSTVIGFDTLNEPNPGWIGCPDINALAPWQDLRQGPTPTPLQALLLANGHTVKVSRYTVTSFGPLWSGWCTVNDNKVNAWLPARPSPQQLHQDGLKAAASFSCSPTADGKGTRIHVNNYTPISELFPASQPPRKDFSPGGCVWAAHGVYSPVDGTTGIAGYFGRHPHSGATVDHDAFTEHFWFPFIQTYACEIRKIVPDTMIFIDPPVNERPPRMSEFPRFGDKPSSVHSRGETAASAHSTTPLHAKSSAVHPSNDMPLPMVDPALDHHLVYAPHWYDGLTLISKNYQPFNMEFLSHKRGLVSALGALRFGYPAVERCTQAQLQLIKSEGQRWIGNYPVLIGEIGIPYDMSNGYAFRTGDFGTQISALNAAMQAVERNLLHATLWNYCPENCYDWGDGWNGEDLSIFSRGWAGGGKAFEAQAPLVAAARSDTNLLTADRSISSLATGGRAIEAFLRAYPAHTAGIPLSFVYARKPTPRFTFSLLPDSPAALKTDTYAALSNLTTLRDILQYIDRIPRGEVSELFFPQLWFPHAASFRMRATRASGSSAGLLWVHFPTQRLLWWTAPHDEGSLGRGQGSVGTDATVLPIDGDHRMPPDAQWTLQCIGVDGSQQHATSPAPRVLQTTQPDENHSETDWWFSWIHGVADSQDTSKWSMEERKSWFGLC